MDITITNEVINYLSSGARADFFLVKNTAIDTTIEFVDSPLLAITEVTIKVLYQSNGETLKEYTITQAASPSFVWAILAADFATAKPLNYSVIATDQDDHCLFYGSFTLI